MLHILPKFGASLTQILFKIAKPESASKFSDLQYGNISANRVSAQNYQYIAKKAIFFKI